MKIIWTEENEEIVMGLWDEYPEMVKGEILKKSHGWDKNKNFWKDSGLALNLDGTKIFEKPRWDIFEKYLVRRGSGIILIWMDIQSMDSLMGKTMMGLGEIPHQNEATLFEKYKQR